MLDNTSDSAEIRWEILKSLLDDFPQLLDRAESYILERKSLAHASSDRADLDVKELMRKAVHRYQKECLQK